MDFKCKICDRIISYANSDHIFYKNHDFECNDCYSIIAKRRYPVNIKNGLTIFTTMGESLGDNIMSSIIKERYLIDNPDENVIFLSNDNRYDYVNHKYDKLFWANQFSGIKDEMPEDAFWFAVSTECTEFSKQGFFPRYNIKQECVLSLKFDYIVFHMRNIEKGKEKNINPAMVYLILNKISHTGNRVVIVGNDNNSTYLTLEILNQITNFNLKIYDKRWLLSLDEISTLCKDAKMFIGIDSGIAHLAAASECKKILSWNYVTKNWFPKTPNRLMAFLAENSTIPNVLNGFDELNKEII